MPHETYWLPYPALLKKLGFKNDYKDRWIMTGGHYVQIVTWHKDGPHVNLNLAEGPFTIFCGELQSEEEFFTLLRQVRWSKAE